MSEIWTLKKTDRFLSAVWVLLFISTGVVLFAFGIINEILLICSGLFMVSHKYHLGALILFGCSAASFAGAQFAYKWLEKTI